MKGRLVAFVGVFCFAMLVVSGAFAGKPDKPGKPGDSEPRMEFIAFSGDFLGGEEVEDCCGNAGPHPEFTLHVPGTGLGDDPEGELYLHGCEYTGPLFMNVFGTGPDAEYMVRFRGWCAEWGEISIEIMGGVVHQEKKPPKVLTATFVDADCRVLEHGCPTPGCGEHIAYVTFTVVRTPL
jgi:hypothetical protein